jgi:predicted RNase H-like nuclease (RuvC/YqgF family)
MAISAELYEFVVKVVEDKTEGIRLLRADFSDLKGVVYELAEAQKRTEQRVEELAEAQKRTEQRVTRLETVVEELAEAQKRTEQRVTRLETVVEELAEAQKRTEQRVTRLETVVEELAEAQKRTEQRVEELAEAQKRTEQRVEELAEAQKRTELVVRNLSIEVSKLSETIGFGIEDVARVVLPGYLQRHEGVLIEDFDRKFFKIGKKEIEINLYGEGRRNGNPITILGESKGRIFAREIKKFIKDVNIVESMIEGEKIKLMFGFYIHPSATEIANQENILLIASYQR